MKHEKLTGEILGAAMAVLKELGSESLPAPRKDLEEPRISRVSRIEKGFSGGRSSGATDGGTSARVFGSFSSWMQENEPMVEPAPAACVMLPSGR